MRYASAESPYPSISPKIAASRACACPRSSSIRLPAPSDITKPFLFLSKGLDAIWGEAYFSTRAFSRTNPMNPVKLSVASHPPATMTSEVPSFISRYASPTACAPAEQVDTKDRLGPLQLKCIERSEVAASGFLLKKFRK